MAFFKFRWPGQSEPAQADKPAKRPRTPQADSIEVMRRRARHRLIGAAVLVLVGVVGFPLLFDTQPRPIPVDIPIEIPDRNKVAPLVVPAPVAEAPAAKPPSAPAVPIPPVPAAAAVQRPAPVPAPAPSRAQGNGLSDGEELVAVARPAASKPAPAKPDAKPEHKPEPKPLAVPAPEPKPAPRPDESARARALLEGRTADSVVAAAEDNRFIVQVGAFADADKAREARTKVERAGLKTYTQVVDTKDGKRTRVRVGPFASRADADKAAMRIKALDLSASVLTL